MNRNKRAQQKKNRRVAKAKQALRQLVDPKQAEFHRAVRQILANAANCPDCQEKDQRVRVLCEEANVHAQRWGQPDCHHLPPSWSKLDGGEHVHFHCGVCGSISIMLSPQIIHSGLKVEVHCPEMTFNGKSRNVQTDSTNPTYQGVGASEADAQLAYDLGLRV